MVMTEGPGFTTRAFHAACQKTDCILRLTVPLWNANLDASVAVRTSATALIGPAVIAPDRVTQVQGARIGRCAGDAASHCTDRRASAGIAGQGADGRTASRADQRATGETITGIGTAAREHQRRGKSCDQ